MKDPVIGRSYPKKILADEGQMTTFEAAGIFQRRCRQIGLLLSGRKSDVIFFGIILLT